MPTKELKKRIENSNKMELQKYFSMADMKDTGEFSSIYFTIKFV